MRLPPLKALRAFVAVAKTLNITQAAEQLFVTQSAVSQQLKLLQDYLQVELITREGNKLQLTEIGKQYAERLDAAFADIHDITKKVVHDCQYENIITLNCTTTFASRWLVPRLSQFQMQHPGLELRISTPGKLIDFDKEEIDAALYIGDTEFPGLHVTELWQDQLLPVCHPDLIKNGNENLFTENAIHIVDAPFREQDWLRWFAIADKDVDLKAYKNIHFPTLDLSLAAAKQGNGIAMGHQAYIQDDLANGKLVYPFDPNLAIPVNYYLVIAQAQQDCNKQIILREWLQEQQFVHH